MRHIDLSCDGEVGDDGLVTIVITATNLTMAEAQALSDRIKDPFRAMIRDICKPVAETLNPPETKQ